VCCCASTPPHMSSWSICALCCVLLSWENRSQSLIQEIMLSNQININFYTDKLKERKSLRRVCTWLPTHDLSWLRHAGNKTDLAV
jgi:hypothetical protein